MLFWNAPITTDTVQNTAAPAVPRAPIDPPRAANKNPGLARATMKPSHQDIALISCRCSTSAVAILSPLDDLPYVACRCSAGSAPGRLRQHGLQCGVDLADAAFDCRVH